jgi:hypothetical protein
MNGEGITKGRWRKLQWVRFDDHLSTLAATINKERLLMACFGTPEYLHPADPIPLGRSPRNHPLLRTLFKRMAFCTTSVAAVLLTACGGGSAQPERSIDQTALVAQGKEIFRFDTFGDESQWSDTLRMHEVIATAVDPTTALSVGLKVDSEALPPAVVQGIQDGSIDLKNPVTTIVLLKLNAVVGVQGKVETIGGKDTLTRVGVTCALCHSTVDDSFAAGIGKRLDGWPNRDLNPGAIIALSPSVSGAAKAVYNSWGKGKYDPRFNFDGVSGPQVIPPAYGLEGNPSHHVHG